MAESMRQLDFDPFSLDLPHESERAALVEMWRQRKADYWQNGSSWLVVEHLPGDEIGIPYARGDITGLGPIFEQLAPVYKAEGYSKLWVRGRPGWARAIQRWADAKVHSVCYEITERA